MEGTCREHKCMETLMTAVKYTFDASEQREK